jgi:hypothetical protein
MQFGRWTVLGDEGDGMWLCRCDCGTMRIVQGGALKAGRSNGCLACRAPANRTHGQTRTPLYKAWDAIVQRCENQKSQAYADYGGRGIAICPEWRSSFSAFSAWAFISGYRPDLTIDRIDNDGDYTPKNCRWATVKQQARNRRSNRVVEWRCRRISVAELSDLTGIRADTIRYRLRHGWPLERAATTQPGTHLKEQGIA